MSPTLRQRADQYQARIEDIERALVNDDLRSGEKLQLLILSGILRGLIEHADETTKLRCDVEAVRLKVDSATPLITNAGTVRALGAAGLALIGVVVAWGWTWLTARFQL